MMPVIRTMLFSLAAIALLQNCSSGPKKSSDRPQTPETGIQPSAEEAESEQLPEGVPEEMPPKHYPDENDDTEDSSEKIMDDPVRGSVDLASNKSNYSSEPDEI